MSAKNDEIDLKILRLLQEDATQSVDMLSEKVSLSRNACWRRVKALEEAGILRAKVALLDPKQLGLGLQAIVMVRALAHTSNWTQSFQGAVRDMPEIMGA